VISICFVSSLFAGMSIEEAWQNVELKNNALKAEGNDVSRAKLKQKSAKSMYLPSVSLSGSYTHSSEPIKIEEEIPLTLLQTTLPISLDLSKQDTFLASLNLLWPLYTGGKIDAAQEIFASALSEAKAKEQMKKDTEFLKLVKYYYGVVVANALYETRVEAQKALSLHYENAKKLKEQGQIANVELLNAQVKYDGAKIETTKAKHKLEIAISALKQLTKSSLTPISGLFINNDFKDEIYYKNETTQNNKALKIIDAKQRQSDSLIDIKKSAWHPQVVGYANYNLYKDDSIIMESLPQWFAGVRVKIDILKRKDRNEEIQIAKLLNTKIKHLKSQAIEDLSLLVEKTYKEMLSSYEEFESLDSSLRLAKENYRLRNISFNEGLSTSVELVDAEMFLMGAKTKRLNAAYNFVQRLSQLSVLSGDREMFFDIEKISKEIR
jgi:outer membrane protein TolC